MTVGSLPNAEFLRRYRLLTTPGARRLALVERFRHDRASFLRLCFPRLFSRPFNRYHRDVLGRPKVRFAERRGRDVYRADAAPRGVAKTTLLKGDLVHDIVYGLEDYIVVVSAETRLARSITKHLRRVFQAKTGRLAELYGPFTVTGGVDEFTVTTGAGHTVGVLARSFGTQIRGANEDGARPTKIAIDDGERPDRVRNPKLRREDWDFLQDDILGCGPIEGGLVVEWRGTVLAPDALLPNLLKTPGWDGALYKACERWPDRMDLWAECGRIYKDLTLGSATTRYQCAWGFYQARRAEMDRGARMLDDAALPLFKFFVEIWTKGLRSVLRERQNEPRTAGTKFFQVDQFHRCRVVGTRAAGGHVLTSDGRKVDLEACRAFAWLDPIPGDELGTMGDDGGAGSGDFAAIAVLLRDPFGYGFLVDLWMRRARDSAQRAALWALCEKWRVERVGIEANGFQRLLGRDFRREQAERREDDKFWQVAVDEPVSSENKEDVIAELEGPTTAGWLQFAEHLPPELDQQLDAFPDGDHDDGAEAVARAWRRSSSRRVGMVGERPGTPPPRSPRPPGPRSRSS